MRPKLVMVNESIKLIALLIYFIVCDTFLLQLELIYFLVLSMARIARYYNTTRWVGEATADTASNYTALWTELWIWCDRFWAISSGTHPANSSDAYSEGVAAVSVKCVKGAQEVWEEETNRIQISWTHVARFQQDVDESKGRSWEIRVSRIQQESMKL
jgi:hypothetical protein